MGKPVSLATVCLVNVCALAFVRAIMRCAAQSQPAVRADQQAAEDIVTGSVIVTFIPFNHALDPFEGVCVNIGFAVFRIAAVESAQQGICKQAHICFIQH